MRLYRILDVSLNLPLGQRIFGVGTVQIASSDQTKGDFAVGPVKNPREVKELLSTTVEKERQENGVSAREFMEQDGEVLG